MITTIEQAIKLAPTGTSGLVCEPWARGEVYGVAADWAQASAPVLFCGADGWEERQYRVADFRHRPAKAMECELRQAIIASGCGEAQAVALVAAATEF